MGKQFGRTADADQRAIQLHLQLQAVEKMPLIEIRFPAGGKTILVADKNRPDMYSIFKVDDFLSLDVQQAKQKGGTFDDLVNSGKKATPRVSQAEIDKEVEDFLRN